MKGTMQPSRERFLSNLRFIGSFLREPFVTGAVWPSSHRLSGTVVANLESSPGGTIVELGPGTGSFTELILQRLGPNDRFIGVEVCEEKANLLRRRFPRGRIVHDSAENLPRYVERQGADCVISGLPWASMSPRMQDRLFDAILSSLRPGGLFIAFRYVPTAWLPTARRFRRGLGTHFKRVERTPIVWQNFPPAQVYRCWRNR